MAEFEKQVAESQPRAAPAAATPFVPAASSEIVHAPPIHWTQLASQFTLRIPLPPTPPAFLFPPLQPAESTSAGYTLLPADATGTAPTQPDPTIPIPIVLGDATQTLTPTQIIHFFYEKRWHKVLFKAHAESLLRFSCPPYWLVHAHTAWTPTANQVAHVQVLAALERLEREEKAAKAAARTAKGKLDTSLPGKRKRDRLALEAAAAAAAGSSKVKEVAEFLQAVKELDINKTSSGSGTINGVNGDAAEGQPPMKRAKTIMEDFSDELAVKKSERKSKELVDGEESCDSDRKVKVPNTEGAGNVKKRKRSAKLDAKQTTAENTGAADDLADVPSKIPTKSKKKTPDEAQEPALELGKSLSSNKDASLDTEPAYPFKPKESRKFNDKDNEKVSKVKKSRSSTVADVANEDSVKKSKPPRTILEDDVSSKTKKVPKAKALSDDKDISSKPRKSVKVSEKMEGEESKPKLKPKMSGTEDDTVLSWKSKRNKPDADIEDSVVKKAKKSEKNKADSGQDDVFQQSKKTKAKKLSKGTDEKVDKKPKKKK
ncbi:hypothetical protein BC830DRAFT_237870 [Chytriomyces sp. MP71]|nr:hypothetical protein BC830DRAFT_237870 [Chytriomyces sp. MP71]